MFGSGAGSAGRLNTLVPVTRALFPPIAARHSAGGGGTLCRGGAGVQAGWLLTSGRIEHMFIARQTTMINWLALISEVMCNTRA